MRNLVVLLCLVLIISCQTKRELKSIETSDDRKPDYGDFLILGTIGDASNLIPFLASDSASHQVAELIYNGLVKYDENLNIVGDLAESFQMSDGGKRIVFKLKKGVLWHDGRELTAEDCEFTYRLITNPETPTPYSGDFMMVKRAYARDRYTFVVEYKEPFAPALASWCVSIVPKHLLEGKDVTKSPLQRNPVGTGPFIFKNWSQGEKIELKANDNYFEGRPFLNGVVFRVIPDMATMFLELKSENIDFSSLTPMQYERQANTDFFVSKFNKYKYLAFAYTYFGFNLKKELFKDIRVRRAIAYAIDKKELIKGVLLGLGVEATGPYKPDMPWYNGNVERFDYNPEKAKKLLTEAGYKDSDGDGILEKDGKPLRFTVLTNQGNDARVKTAEIIQRKLKEVGIDMKILVLEWATFIKEFVNKRRFDALILGWTIPQDPDLYDIWHSSKMDARGLNHYSYSNPEVDKLLELGRKTVDDKKRKEIYFEVQERIASDVPCVFLYIPYALPVVHKRFIGVKPMPAGIAYNMYRWGVPKIEQKY
ncbi:MAG: peptide-binding protein [bacterium]